MSVEHYPDVVMPECPTEKILNGQKALVTGGASGIGRAVAIALGQAGADVVVNYVRGEDQANEVAAEIRKCGSRAYAHQADVSSEDQVRKMFQKMFQEFKTIDILINNAGLQKDAPFDEKHCPGSRPISYPCQQHCTGCHSDADKQTGLGNTGSLQGTDGACAL